MVSVYVLKYGSESRLQSSSWRPTYQSIIISKLGFETEILGLVINYSSVLSEIKICNGLTFYALCFHKLKTSTLPLLLFLFRIVDETKLSKIFGFGNDLLGKKNMHLQFEIKQSLEMSMNL